MKLRIFFYDSSVVKINFKYFLILHLNFETSLTDSINIHFFKIFKLYLQGLQYSEIIRSTFQK